MATSLPPLADASDLAAFPGAPFDDALVISACAAVRAEAGWHIAPSVSETLTVDSPGGPLLTLPTLALTEVSAVRDVTDPDDTETLGDWRVSAAGMLARTNGQPWPAGFGVLEVDVTHGYDQCPAELLPVIAEHCQASTISSTVQQEASGSESVTYFGAGASGSVALRGDARVRRYRVGARP
jgi:hypothetical protein